MYRLLLYVPASIGWNKEYMGTRRIYGAFVTNSDCNFSWALVILTIAKAQTVASAREYCEWQHMSNSRQVWKKS